MTDTATRTEKKLSVIPKGHWRNRWSAPVEIVLHSRDNPEIITGKRGPGEWLSDESYPSAEIAEQRAIENITYHADRVLLKGIKYLGPVFFPDTTDT